MPKPVMQITAKRDYLAYALRYAVKLQTVPMANEPETTNPPQQDQSTPWKEMPVQHE